jgi:hypothetical protein
VAPSSAVGGVSTKIRDMGTHGGTHGRSGHLPIELTKPVVVVKSRQLDQLVHVFVYLEDSTPPDDLDAVLNYCTCDP